MPVTPQSTLPYQTPSDSPAQLLAHSAFAMAALETLAVILAIPFLLAAPIRPNPRLLVLLGCGGVIIALVVFCGLLLRRSPEQLVAPSGRLIHVLSWRGVSIVLSLVLIELFLIAYFLITGIAPTLSALLIPLAVWGLIGLSIIGIANRDSLREGLARTQGMWSSLGLTLSALAGLVVLYVLTLWVLNSTNIVGQLRGSADYRVLTFFGGLTDAEQSRAYWAELGNLQAQWLPYSYARIQPTAGQYINVDSRGLRRTASYVEEGVDAPEVFFFGGSTVWGDGSRDEYTIPSQVARLLNQQGQSARVFNFGQVAYVSMQDLILFENQLALGNTPDEAVFYGGFNDIASTYMHGMAGLPHNEVNRVQEFVVGRMLDAGQIILRRPDIQLDDVDVSLVANPDGSAQATADRYLANVRLIKTVAQEYGVKVLFVWQPSILAKVKRTPEEQGFVEANEAAWPGWGKLYAETDAIVREQVKDDPAFLILTDLFKDETGYTFIDRVHITEDGNNVVAQAIATEIIMRIRN